MKFIDKTSNPAACAPRTPGVRRFRLLPVLFTGLLFFETHPAVAALSFGRGTTTAVGCAQVASSPDSVTITAALTGPGTITSALAIPANRIQYDVINCDTGPLYSWTLFYNPAVGPQIIGAATPLGYVTSAGVDVPQGGAAYTTLFNAGYGIYNYNTGAPWIIDYEPDHITFTSATGLPMNDGVGFVNPAPYLPSFAVDFNPALGVGPVPATAKIGSLNVTGQVLGPVPGSGCLTILCTNIVVDTCNPCTTVPFSATALDTCCAVPPTIVYNLPATYCFPVNTTTPVQVIAYDQCGNAATNYFTVTVNQATNCTPPNCITINASNIVAYTCDPCTPVSYNVTAVDTCCPAGSVTTVFNPPETTCFPQNSATPVTVTAYDQCGHTNTAIFTVTVNPGPNCGNTNCIALYQTNIVVYTCSNCTTVPFNTQAFDTCCPGGVTLVYNPPTNNCFGVNTTTPVTITASDACGNSVIKFITVKVLPDPNCGPTNCIAIYATNIVAYTCNSCTPVSPSAFAVDFCCPGAPPTLVYSLPPGFCYPLNSTTPVQITAYDQCGNTNTAWILVTVLPGAGCGNGSPLSISGLTGPSPGGTNYITVWWPAQNAQLLESMDLLNWFPITGATNPPYVIPNRSKMGYFRLQYVLPTP